MSNFPIHPGPKVRLGGPLEGGVCQAVFETRVYIDLKWRGALNVEVLVPWLLVIKL